MILEPKQIPNAICVARILLVGPVVWALVTERHGMALGLIAIAGLSDALDGYLARRFDWRTRLGGLLDPAADKLLVFATFVTLSAIDLVPAWFTALVVGRDVVIISGTLVYQRAVGPVEGAPTRVSKLNTVLQISFALLIVIDAWLGWPGARFLQALGLSVLTTIAISLAQYTARGVKRLREARRRRVVGPDTRAG